MAAACERCQKKKEALREAMVLQYRPWKRCRGSLGGRAGDARQARQAGEQHQSERRRTDDGHDNDDQVTTVTHLCSLSLELRVTLPPAYNEILQWLRLLKVAKSQTSGSATGS